MASTAAATPTRNNNPGKDKTSPPPLVPPNNIKRNSRATSDSAVTPPRGNVHHQPLQEQPFNRRQQQQQQQQPTKKPVTLTEENSRLREQLEKAQHELSQWRDQALLLQLSNSNSASLPSSLWEAAQDSGMLWNGSGPAVGPKHRRRVVMKASTSWSADDGDIDTHEVKVVKGEQQHPQSGLHHRRYLVNSNSTTAAIHLEEGNALLMKTSSEQSHHSLNIHHEPNPQPQQPYDDMQNQTFRQILLDRGLWLVALLCLQSLSSFILKHNEMLLQRHVIIVRFLTMLVGAGGNAGNQASVRVIRGLATGSVDEHNARPYFWKEMRTGVGLSLLLGVAGCLRAAIFMTPPAETVAITTSLFSIVMISIMLGTLLPFLMRVVHVDPAHSSTTIQVIMDILGVAITVRVCAFVLESDMTVWMRGDDDGI